MNREGFDFGANRAFWRRWGNEAALPFRLENLRDLQLSLQGQGMQSWLYGKSLRDSIRQGRLGEDHDDDLLIAPEDLHSVKHLIVAAAQKMGFEIIRELPELISLARFERYVDIHPNIIGADGATAIRVNGHQLLTFDSAEAYVATRYPNGPTSRRRESVRKKTRNLRRVVASSFRATGDLIEPGRRKQRARLVSLSEAEFLSLKFEDEQSMNWRWRGNHLRRVSTPGATIGDSIQDLLSSAEYPDFQFSETDTSKSFFEPINLSRKFWQSGDNFFLLPLMHGFRHLVVPYEAANLYIISGLRPLLYSDEYYRRLPKMSDDEIQAFLVESPVEVRDGSLVSGRHRAAAMMGRLMRGEEYIPISALQL